MAKEPNTAGEARRRADAEARLVRAPPAAPDAAAAAQLLHELQVHKVELELQNEELRRTQLELEVARDEYRDLYDFSPVGYLTIGEEGSITEANLTGAALLGVTRAALLGRSADPLFAPADQPGWRAHLEASRRTDGPVGCELQLRGADGPGAPVQLTSLCRVGAAGRRGLVRTAFQDISVRRRAQRALDTASLRLVEEDRRKSDFLAVLSHELRSPLSTIRNGLWLLDRAEPGTEPYLRARTVLHRQAALLAGLVDDLLDVTRISQGKFQIRRTPLDLRGVVRGACQDAQVQFERRGLELRCATPEVPVWVEADEARLAQLVGNLLGNARKFTPPGGRVEVDVGARPGWCEVRVRDTGAGLEAKELERIFEPFAQAGIAHPGARGGLGIGLSLVREVAARHGGRAYATSPGLGRGAEFVVTLPLAVGTPPALPPGAAPQPVTDSLEVLVVEDDEDAATTLAELLELLGHRAAVAGSGGAGVEKALATRPDVLICDLGLPDMSGLAVIRAIRAAEDGPFAIALTGFAQPEDRALALQAGFDAHLSKPASIQGLVALLAKAPRRGR